ncbi:MAG: histidine kinase [Bacteroidota bacterium]
MQRKIHPYLGFNDFWFIVIGIIMLGIFVPIIFFNADLFDKRYPYINEVFEAMMFSTGYWMMSRKIIIHFRKKIPDFQDSKKRILKVIISCVVGAFLLSIVLIPLVNILFRSLNLVTAPTSAVRGIINTYTVTFFILAIYESIWFFSQLKLSYAEKEQIKIAHLQTQLDSLRNQVNPHFLFNSLNTLNYIVTYENKKSATAFIDKLSKVYRYILESREDSTILLAEELAFIEAYIAIQKERFFDSLEVIINIPKEHHQRKIIPLSLQLLIENAIKHNVISKKKKLTIRLEIDMTSNQLVVSNNLQKKNKILHSTKVGLQNIKERYQLLSEKYQVLIEESGQFFTVRLPIIQ